ncbi:uncharacterized protein LOC105688962 isoform X1 [Athalia rosae]|uniref:uncharacterized protein LOC105688962 isoform X1 n=1 Tax=Athalia rosae TaxID=37344 RepID=UPI00203333F4|nr:uncharacterized protein LOC105688962 isoform X1 [Athalia rosae]XP_048509964.1 uncharacterized protein LOC105688962 isoform X1 [Athalia rosae]
MGNNSSSHHHHAQGGVAREMGPGWTHSFPRDMHRQHLQSSGHKVLPEPPNQRLRATNNGSIIHNGGTISGRRPSALTLPHDLNKQAAYRTRSASASNFGQPRPQNGDPQYYRHQHGDPRDREIAEFKRFGSEPDLRYSPTEQGRYDRHQGYTERDVKERDSRYSKGKKKYKAPPPPNRDGSSPDSYNWSGGHDGDATRPSEDIRPPPRKSRLFKTRAETKRAQSNWTSLQERETDSKRWDDVQSSKENLVWRQQQERWNKDERRPKMFDGKNTLQRSLSSPEFQAELMKAARKVRSKMNHQREGPVGEAAPINHREYPTSNQGEFIDDRRIDEATTKHREDRFFDERRTENKNARNQEISYDHRRTEQSDLRYQKESSNDRQTDRNSRQRAFKKSATYDVEVDVGQRLAEKKLLMERIEKQGQSFDDRLSDKQKLDYSEERRADQQRHNDRLKGKALEDFVEMGKRIDSRTRSESPMRQYRDKNNDRRSQGSGRESTPEPTKTKDPGNFDLRNNIKTGIRSNGYSYNENRRSEPIPKIDMKESKSKEKLSRKPDVRAPPVKNWEILPPAGKSPPKTFYFGMDLTTSRDPQDLMEHQMQQIQSRLNHIREPSSSPETSPGEMDDDKPLHTGDDIALKLRPTLPKKQLEIPRFSPSAAWRLLSALDTPYPSMSTASEEGPVLFEERIERLSRPPPPLVALGPRSSHDKSGDSGISGDAGAVNDDSLDIITNRAKGSIRPTWTPQQDLGEESSSDAGVDSPPPMATPVKFPPRPHVFSLSLPRDDNRMSLYNPEYKIKESSFNSLQKLKRSVSGALGLGALDVDRKQDSDVLDGNWLLSTSAPNSLQHSQPNGEGTGTPSPGWETNFVENEDEGKPDFPIIMKPPSFSYLASGGHVMYLPESNGTVYQTQSLNYRNTSSEDKNSNNSNSRYKKSSTESKKVCRYPNSDAQKYPKESKEFGLFRDRRFTDGGLRSRKFSNFSKSCENISEMKQRERSPSPGPENLQDVKDSSSDLKVTAKRSSKSKRFTFQSTVRQIERRRLAEKLSREAEAKEQQRKGELEAMRKVEEEFQKKRAREKANIRQQLRLFNLDETTGSLPVVWDSASLSRAEPDGAPSSSASSPTSAPQSKLTATRKNSGSSDEYNRKAQISAHVPTEYRHQQQQREYKDYRSRYYDCGPESAPHIEFKQTTVHPKVVYDIPKSAPVYVDAKIHPNKSVNLNSTPRSDNYRKDFAHGAVAARSSLASSDSELSQPNTRPHSRQTANKVRIHRSRSASPARSHEDASSEEECPVEPITRERIPANNLMLNAIQPFVREKSYRPISYNPQSPPPIPS